MAQARSQENTQSDTQRKARGSQPSQDAHQKRSTRAHWPAPGARQCAVDAGFGWTRAPARRASLGGDLALVLGEGSHGVHRAVLALVLDGLAIGGDEVDRGEGLGVHLGGDELALLVAAELVDGQARRAGELLVLLLHALAELAPRRVDDDDGLLALALEGGHVLGRGEVGHGARLPEVAVEGLLGAGDVDAALRL